MNCIKFTVLMTCRHDLHISLTAIRTWLQIHTNNIIKTEGGRHHNWQLMRISHLMSTYLGKQQIITPCVQHISTIHNTKNLMCKNRTARLLPNICTYILTKWRDYGREIHDPQEANTISTQKLMQLMQLDFHSIKNSVTVYSINECYQLIAYGDGS